MKFVDVNQLQPVFDEIEIVCNRTVFNFPLIGIPAHKYIVVSGSLHNRPHVRNVRCSTPVHFDTDVDAEIFCKLTALTQRTPNLL